MPSIPRLARAGGNTRSFGYSVVELLIALSLGTIVLAAAIGYLITEVRTLGGDEIRRSVAANGRYIGVTLRHDVQRAGVGIESTTGFGTVAVWPGDASDTLIVLHVPHTTSLFPAHLIVPPPGDENPLPPGGICGLDCIEVLKDRDGEFELEAGDLVRVQVVEERRLALIESIEVSSDTSVMLTFTDATEILRQPAGLRGGLRLDRFATYVQELAAIVYYVDGEKQLIRAMRLNLNGSPRGDVLAYGVDQFDARLVFADGEELERPDPYDEDDSNDYDDVVAVKVKVTVTADRVDPRVNQGELLARSYEWTIAPRNLRYEKDRI